MGALLFAWVGILVTNIVVERQALASGEVWIEHRRPYLRDWGWGPVIGFVVGITVAFVLAPGLMLAITRSPIRSVLSTNKPPVEARDPNSIDDITNAAPERQRE